MNTQANQIIKKYLEEYYDIPFDIESGFHYNEAWFKIKPKNEEKNLFCLFIELKNKLRLVIDVSPEEYAVDSINDMSCATEIQKNSFVDHAKDLIALGAKVHFFINNSIYSPEKHDTWPKHWKSYRMRITKSPVFPEEEDTNIETVVKEWALKVVGMFLSLLSVTQIEGCPEGKLYRYESNKFERNPINRNLCLAANGYSCKICGFDFEKVYGKIGHRFIHVHHIIPVSKIGPDYKINPIKDLIPVCPNCHAMLHQTEPPCSPEEIKALLSKKK